MNPDDVTHTHLPPPNCGPSEETGAFVSEHYIIDAMGKYTCYVVYENAVRIVSWMEDTEEWGVASTYFAMDEARKAYIHAIENGAKEVNLNVDNLSDDHGHPIKRIEGLREYKSQVKAHAEKKRRDKYSYDKDIYGKMEMNKMTDALKAYEDIKDILYKEKRSYDNYALEA
tara:strand:+ start:6745 stop:7257 length:513 start_codon:yes stop_codon:yes gene_type:complete